MARRSANALCIDPFWAGRADCRHCPIRQKAIFSSVPNTALEQTLASIDNYAYEAKCRIYCPDDSPNAVFSLRQGVVKLSVPLGNGANRVVRLLYPGDVFGLESLVGQAYQHSAFAMQKVNLCRIPVSVIETLNNKLESFRRELMQRWQRNLDQSDRFITALSTGPAPARMARLLMFLQQHAGSDGIHAFSREDLGELLGISTETSSRIIADFKRQGLIEERGRFFVYTDAEGIAALAGE